MGFFIILIFHLSSTIAESVVLQYACLRTFEQVFLTRGTYHAISIKIKEKWRVVYRYVPMSYVPDERSIDRQSIISDAAAAYTCVCTGIANDVYNKFAVYLSE